VIHASLPRPAISFPREHGAWLTLAGGIAASLMVGIEVWPALGAAVVLAP